MNSKTLGGGLILLGLMMILLKFFHVTADLTLFFIGGCFLAVYFGSTGSKANKIGFLIPGCILICIGCANIANSISFLRSFDDVLFFVSLGTAFLAIRVIGGMNGSRVNWATIVALALYGFSAFLLAIKLTREFGFLGTYLWPIIFICVGVAIIVGNLGVKLFKRRY